ncbi:hypothetical protein [Kineosporia sp. A_224]|uniref:hypothetical protein n=1 Tax=Kineosporia sp. A_224 TaxID=1962180 RepID=UPI000B4A78D3|nr:hypothetical protein [Kineosporia sp. A_224]
MSQGTGWAVALAVAAAVGYGLASVLQAVGMRGADATVTGMRRPAYLAGAVLDVAAWGTSLVALRTLPVFEVQSVLAGSLVVTALAARVLLGALLRRRDVVAIAAAVLCLAAVAWSASAQEAAALGPVTRWALAAAAVPVVVLGVRATRPGTSAVAAGLAFGGTALCSRAATLPAAPWQHLGATAGALATDPLVWALVVYGAGGVVFYAQALQHGSVGPVTALLWITEVVVPALVGVAILGDRVRPGWTVPAAVAVVGVLAAAVTLAGSAAAHPRQS